MVEEHVLVTYARISFKRDAPDQRLTFRCGNQFQAQHYINNQQSWFPFQVPSLFCSLQGNPSPPSPDLRRRAMDSTREVGLPSPWALLSSFRTREADMVVRKIIQFAHHDTQVERNQAINAQSVFTGSHVFNWQNWAFSWRRTYLWILRLPPLPSCRILHAKIQRSPSPHMLLTFPMYG